MFTVISIYLTLIVILTALGFVYWDFQRKLIANQPPAVEPIVKKHISKAVVTIKSGLLKSIKDMFTVEEDEMSKEDLKTLEEAEEAQAEGLKNLVISALASEETKQIMRNILVETANEIMENMQEDVKKAQEGQTQEGVQGLMGMNTEQMGQVMENPLPFLVQAYFKYRNTNLKSGGTNTLPSQNASRLFA